MIALGWLRDLPDQRDLRYSDAYGDKRLSRRLIPARILYPERVDLTDGGRNVLWPEVFDQGTLNASVPCAVIAALAFELGRRGVPETDRIFSRSYLYWRVRERRPIDTGAGIRDAIKKARAGLPLEKFWPYDLRVWAMDPDETSRLDADKHELQLRYARIHGLREIFHCLASGRPIVCGLSVHEHAFDGLGARNSVLQLPHSHDRLLGGLGLTLVGYNHVMGCLQARAPLGDSFGFGGCFWIPFEYVTRGLLADLWTLR